MDTWFPKWFKKTAGHNVPRLASDGRYSPIDYGEALNCLAEVTSDGCSDLVNWGHLIIDEGQDFPKLLYTCFAVIRDICFANSPEESHPGLTLLADENQRITERNSTIEEIRDQAQVKRVYKLTKNYRNTKPIAEFASEFFSEGIESGKAALPDRKGERPRVLMVAKRGNAVDAIVSYIERHENEEVAVLVYSTSERRSYYNALSGRFKDHGKLRVQTYGDRDHGAEGLLFDVPGVTVLCYASAKGLEFDAVFLPELQSLPASESNAEAMRMKLYVMCTRARRSLTLIYQGTDGFERDGIGRWIPGRNSGLADWKTWP